MRLLLWLNGNARDKGLHLGLTHPESDKVSIEIAEPVTGDHCY